MIPLCPYGLRLGSYLVLGGNALAVQACGSQDPSQPADGLGGSTIAPVDDGTADGTTDGVVDGTTNGVVDGTTDRTSGAGGAAATDGATATGGAGGAAATDGATATGGAAPDTTYAKVIVNEVVASNTAGITDEAGGTGDWLELYNPGSETVNLEGYFITDRLSEPQRWALPAGLVIPPGAVLMLWADSDEEQGPNHIGFNLNRDAEGVYISDPAGTLFDGVEWTAAPRDHSLARFPDGTGEFAWCAAPTPGMLNGDACAQ